MVQRSMLLEARSKPILVHRVKEFLCDEVTRGLGNHRIDAAMRAQGGESISIIDPFCDLSGIVDLFAVEAAASGRRLELLAVRCTEAMGFDDVGHHRLCGFRIELGEVFVYAGALGIERLTLNLGLLAEMEPRHVVLGASEKRKRPIILLPHMVIF